MSKVASVGTDDFQSEVLDAQEPVIVDFYAEWCPPCKMLAPVLDKVANQFSGQVKVLKCDVDAHSEVAARYGVSTIPNLMFFKGGQVVDQAVGYVSESQLSGKVSQVVGS